MRETPYAPASRDVPLPRADHTPAPGIARETGAHEVRESDTPKGNGPGSGAGAIAFECEQRIAMADDTRPRRHRIDATRRDDAVLYAIQLCSGPEAHTPSHRHVAVMTRMSVPSVKRAIRSLVDAGRLTVEVHAGPKGRTGHRTNRYVVHGPVTRDPRVTRLTYRERVDLERRRAAYHRPRPADALAVVTASRARDRARRLAADAIMRARHDRRRRERIGSKVTPNKPRELTPVEIFTESIARAREGSVCPIASERWPDMPCSPNRVGVCIDCGQPVNRKGPP